MATTRGWRRQRPGARERLRQLRVRRGDASATVPPPLKQDPPPPRAAYPMICAVGAATPARDVGAATPAPTAPRANQRRSRTPRLRELRRDDGGEPIDVLLGHVAGALLHQPMKPLGGAGGTRPGAAPLPTQHTNRSPTTPPPPPSRVSCRRPLPPPLRLTSLSCFCPFICDTFAGCCYRCSLGSNYVCWVNGVASFTTLRSVFMFGCCYVERYFPVLY